MGEVHYLIYDEDDKIIGVFIECRDALSFLKVQYEEYYLQNPMKYTIKRVEVCASTSIKNLYKEDNDE